MQVPHPERPRPGNVVGAPAGLRRDPGFWRRLGGEGLLASLLLHGALLLLFAVWVIVTITDEARTDPETFATGAGGGSRGEQAKIYEHRLQPRHAQNLAQTSARITSKSATATVALPDLPTTSSPSLLAGLAGGGSSRGFGGGSGGGIGSGKGVGVGNARNFVGKPVMGMRIRGERIAVYLDNSFSMIAYLDTVEGAIKEKFPDADVFRYFAAFLHVENGRPLGTGSARRPSIPTMDDLVQRFGKGRQPPWTDSSRLSIQGRVLFRRMDAACRVGGLAAWLDHVLRENYDAVVIFSDFHDAVTQYDTTGGGPRVVFDQRPSQPTVERRTSADKAWQRRWHATFSQADDGKGPRLYLFSIDKQPVAFWQEMVKASGGEVKLVPELRRR
jgi:hypothetical protein